MLAKTKVHVGDNEPGSVVEVLYRSHSGSNPVNIKFENGQAFSVHPDHIYFEEWIVQISGNNPAKFHNTSMTLPSYLDLEQVIVRVEFLVSFMKHGTSIQAERYSGRQKVWRVAGE